MLDEAALGGDVDEPVQGGLDPGDRGRPEQEQGPAPGQRGLEGGGVEEVQADGLGVGEPLRERVGVEVRGADTLTAVEQGGDGGAADIAECAGDQDRGVGHGVASSGAGSGAAWSVGLRARVTQRSARVRVGGTPSTNRR